MHYNSNTLAGAQSTVEPARTSTHIEMAGAQLVTNVQAVSYAVTRLDTVLARLYGPQPEEKSNVANLPQHGGSIGHIAEQLALLDRLTAGLHERITRLEQLG